MRYKFTKYIESQDLSATNFDQLMDLFRKLLLATNGDVNEALNWLTQIDQKYGVLGEGLSMSDFIEDLKKQGIIRENNEVLGLTSKGNKKIREDSLREIFTNLNKKRIGSHETPFSGKGTERDNSTRKFNFGDSSSNIDFTRTINNAIHRAGLDNFSLSEDDLEVYETEHQTSCATVLMIDISHSMILYGEDRITPAKTVAMALAELIRRKFPKDSVNVIAFGDEAFELKIEEIPYLSVGPFHTNTKAGLQLAQKILKSKKNDNKQIVMITDGKPSAIKEGIKIYKNPFGLDRKIVNRTLDEAVMCRKSKITITTFMIARDKVLVDFVNKLTEINKGRAYFSQLNKLGEFLLVDYIKNRKKRLR